MSLRRKTAARPLELPLPCACPEDGWVDRKRTTELDVPVLEGTRNARYRIPVELRCASEVRAHPHLLLLLLLRLIREEVEVAHRQDLLPPLSEDRRRRYFPRVVLVGVLELAQEVVPYFVESEGYRRIQVRVAGRAVAPEVAALHLRHHRAEGEDADAQDEDELKDLKAAEDGVGDGTAEASGERHRGSAGSLRWICGFCG